VHSIDTTAAGLLLLLNELASGYELFAAGASWIWRSLISVLSYFSFFQKTPENFPGSYGVK
jgi:hypothetical protein